MTGSAVESTRTSTSRGSIRALALATLAFAVNFWAWGMLSPLGPAYKKLLELSPVAVSVLVAVPVIVGSLGRIPLGALTDRYGGRLVFGVVSLLGVLPVALLAFVTDYAMLIAGGVLLGITGATFAIGVPFVNAWFPPERRGLALGVFGMGNIGTAIASFLTPRIAESWGRPTAFWIVAFALTLTGLAFLLLGRNAPDWRPSYAPVLERLGAAVRLRPVRELAAIYAVTFGGFVAFGVYLPLYLQDSYDLTTADAAFRAAGFIVLATLARPIGGSLADRIGGVVVLRVALGTVGIGAIVVSFQPPMPVATVAFLTIAVALGAGSGGVFQLVARRVPQHMVGSATGVVGAAGGLGGFLPPLVMGLVAQLTGSYAIGLMLLSDVALAALVYCVFVLAREPGRVDEKV